MEKEEIVVEGIVAVLSPASVAEGETAGGESNRRGYQQWGSAVEQSESRGGVQEEPGGFYDQRCGAGESKEEAGGCAAGWIQREFGLQ